MNEMSDWYGVAQAVRWAAASGLTVPLGQTLVVPPRSGHFRGKGHPRNNWNSQTKRAFDKRVAKRRAKKGYA